MLKNYIKVTFRNLRKTPAYSAVNILGLSVAVTCCILVFLFVQFETSYDSFHQKSDNIFFLVNEDNSGGSNLTGITPLPYGPELSNQFPEIKDYVRITNRSGTVERNGNKFSETLTFTDPEFLLLFDFGMQGNGTGKLLEPGDVILTASSAEKYFGSEDPVGKSISITIDGQPEEFTVRAIMKDAPPNSSVDFNILVSMDRFPLYDEYSDDLTTSVIHTWILTEKGTSVTDLQNKMSGYLNDRWPESEGQAAPHIKMIPLSSMHFTDLQFGPGSPGNADLLWVMAAVVALILMISCINFMLLAIGRATKRGKEVGIRKILGANRSQVMRQFWGETFIQCLCAVGIGILLVELFLPTFNQLASTEMSLGLVGAVPIAVFALLLVLLLTFAAGLYPALIQSGFTPSENLYKQTKFTGFGLLGRSLIVVQFSISIGLIVGTIAMFYQLDYLRNKPLGFDGDQVVMIPTGQVNAMPYLSIVRDEGRSYPGVISVSGTSISFTQGGAWGTKEIAVQGKTVTTRDYMVDQYYLETMGIDLINGRNLSDSFPSDPTESVIVNRAFVDEAGMEDPVGQIVEFRGQRQIIGVVENFHHQSLHEQINPLALHASPGWPVMHVAVRVTPDRFTESIAFLEEKWEQVYGSGSFDYSFLDEQMDQIYQAEERWTEIISYLSILAVAIAAIGLFGLTSIALTNRSKEIGMRKVLGATASQVLMLVSKNFGGLFAISFLVATPLSYLAVQDWLGGYAYHVDLAWWMFGIAGIISLLVIMLAIGYQTFKVAFMSPLDSLRAE